MPAPLITVLMAVYDGEKCLTRTIGSILNQTFTDFEFLIVNDCSTDRTVDVIQSYDDERIRVHNSKTNMGQTKSLNVGLDLAKAKYIARMDADDYSLPERLEKQYRYITRHPEYSVVSTDCLVIDEFGARRSISKGCSEYKDVIVKLLTGSPINHVSVLMNKEHIARVGGYDCKYRIVADLDLWSRLIRKGYKISNLHEVLSAYRLSERSYSYLNNVRAMQEKRDIFCENITSFSSFPVNKASVEEVITLFSDGFANMPKESILRAEDTYKNIIVHLRPQFGARIAEVEMNRLLAKNYWIAAYHYILEKRQSRARHVIRLCIRNHGVMPYSVAIYLLTYLPISAIRKLNYVRARFLS